MRVGREEVMFEVSAAQLWSGLFFWTGSLHGKGAHSSQKAMICSTSVWGSYRNVWAHLTLSVSQPFFNTLMSSFVTSIVQPSCIVSGACISMGGRTSNIVVWIPHVSQSTGTIVEQPVASDSTYNSGTRPLATAIQN